MTGETGQEAAPGRPAGHTWNSVSIGRNNAANRLYDNTFSLCEDGGSIVTLQKRRLGVRGPSLQKMPTSKQGSKRTGERVSCIREGARIVSSRMVPDRFLQQEPQHLQVSAPRSLARKGEGPGLGTGLRPRLSPGAQIPYGVLPSSVPPGVTWGTHLPSMCCSSRRKYMTLLESDQTLLANLYKGNGSDSSHCWCNGS